MYNKSLNLKENYTYVFIDDLDITDQQILLEYKDKHSVKYPKFENMIQMQNLYSYCCNNPTNKEDPTGNNTAAGAIVGAPAGPVGAAAGAVIGTIIGAVATGITIYTFKEHTKIKDGDKKRTNDKHTKPRSGRSSEKKKQKSNWKKRK